MHSLKTGLTILFLATGLASCTSGSSGSGSSGVVSNFGSTDGTKGGPCLKTVVDDSNRTSADCNSGDQDRCERSAKNFIAKYPNVDCNYDDGHGTTIHISTQGSDGGTNTSTPVTGHDLCEQRSADLMHLLNDADADQKQAEYDRSHHQPLQTSADLREELRQFDVNYGPMNCPNQMSKEQLDTLVVRAIQAIDETR